MQSLSLPRAIDRRGFLRTGLTAVSALALSPLLTHRAYAALVSSPARSIALHNLHTGETCALTYWERGAYVPEALARINHILRDHRDNEEHAMDVALLDLLAALHGHLETAQPFEVISGYRSPASNAMLHARSGEVAGKSLHMEGKAMDIRVPDRALASVHNTALAMGLGGVGYYPRSDFVHVDTGRVRQWAGT